MTSFVVQGPQPKNHCLDHDTEELDLICQAVLGLILLHGSKGDCDCDCEMFSELNNSDVS